MLKGKKGKLIALLTATTLAVSASFFVTGTVIVNDQTGQISSVAITNGLGERSLIKIPGGYFVGIPDADGSIKLRCTDGSAIEVEYVTHGMHTRHTAVGTAPCKRSRNLG